MSSQTSWRPGLPKSQLFDEKTWLQGAILSAVAYGTNLALFIMIIPLFSTRLKVDMKHNRRASRQTKCLLTYVCVMFILVTVAVAAQAELMQLSFIENRDFPGGPAAYVEIMYSIPINDLGNYCFCMVNWFSDSLLLWRCWVIYGSSATSIWLVMAVPGLMLLASFVTGTLFLGKVSRASSSPYIFELIYATISFSLNIVLTLMIVIRLYLHRRRIAKLLGHRHAAQYTSIICMLTESAAILAVMTIWFLIPFTMGNSFANIPLRSLVQVQAAASYMIIFRVAKGTAWTLQTADSEFTIPNIQFQTASESVEHSADSLATPHPRNQFPLNGPRDMLDTEQNSRVSVHEASPGDSAGVIEKDRPNTP